MNKTKKGALGAAGVGVVALAMIGGGTFALWSDFQTVEENTVGADTLALDITESATMRFDNVKLAPGQARDTAYFVASRTGTSTPQAKLSMTLQNLEGEENGCDSNSEAYEESNGSITDQEDTNAPCNTLVDNEGQFTQQALYYVQARKAANPAECTTANMGSRLLNTVLAQAEGKEVNLLASGETLGAGEGVCVIAQVFMPDSVSQYGLDANNKSQGDQASFDIRFDLTQVTPNHP